jgi:CRP/FNR family transcriptional regulator
LAFCGALKEDELAKLDAIAEHLRFGKRRIVFHEGDEAGYVFNVTTGTLRLYKLLPDGRRQITGFVLPGDFLGLSSRGQFSYTAEAVTETMVCRFSWHKLAALFDEFPEMEKRLLDKAHDELAVAQEQLLLLGRKTSLEKVASFLFSLSKRAERWGFNPSPVMLSMTRRDIADYLGVTLETVSRTFRLLKESDVIALPETHRIVLTDRGRLKNLAEGI